MRAPVVWFLMLAFAGCASGPYRLTYPSVERLPVRVELNATDAWTNKGLYVVWEGSVRVEGEKQTYTLKVLSCKFFDRGKRLTLKEYVGNVAEIVVRGDRVERLEWGEDKRGVYWFELEASVRDYEGRTPVRRKVRRQWRKRGMESEQFIYESLAVETARALVDALPIAPRPHR